MRASAFTAALLSLPLVGIAPVALAPAALAQGNPSAADIINSLRPGAGMSGGTRGIGIARPPAGEPGGPGAASGTRPVGGLPSAASSAPRRPQAASSASQHTTTTAPSVNLTVQFANNSAELTPAAARTLDELGQALSSQALSSYRFRIEGHTDAVGSRDHNQALSEQRAAKVVEYLASKFNLDRSKLEAVGFGPDQPLVPSPANVAQPRNRRVTVVNLGT